MESYIGTKLVEAMPMTKGEFKDYKVEPIPYGNEQFEDGYLVKYPDGYESWSPKDVFDEAYRRCDNMTFGLAIEAMKKGYKVARKGWNGKGMFLYLTKGSIIQLDEMKIETANHLRASCNDRGMDSLQIGSHIDMKAADNSIVIGWLASQTDMLAEDWVIVE